MSFTSANGSSALVSYAPRKSEQVPPLIVAERNCILIVSYPCWYRLRLNLVDNIQTGRKNLNKYILDFIYLFKTNVLTNWRLIAVDKEIYFQDLIKHSEIKWFASSYVISFT